MIKYLTNRNKKREPKAGRGYCKYCDKDGGLEGSKCKYCGHVIGIKRNKKRDLNVGTTEVKINV
jgi:ligand-binding sensor protein